MENNELSSLHSKLLYGTCWGGGGGRETPPEKGVEEPGEQCNVVFALIFTEPVSEVLCVCVCGGGTLNLGLVSIKYKNLYWTYIIVN
jgi:hypothetical protein